MNHFQNLDNTALYANLKPHPDFTLINGDYVVYIINDVPQYSILVYEPEVYSFVLINCKDSSFNEFLRYTDSEGNSKIAIDMLFEVGIENLVKFEDFNK